MIRLLCGPLRRKPLLGIEILSHTRQPVWISDSRINSDIPHPEGEAMDKRPNGFSRREMLEMAIGAGGLALYGDTASAFAITH